GLARISPPSSPTNTRNTRPALPPSSKGFFPDLFLLIIPSMRYQPILFIVIISSFAFAESPSASSPTWKKLTLSDKFYCEGANYADFNKDGKIDVVSGPWWYEGPDFVKKHEIYKPTGNQEGGSYKPDNDYSDNFFAFIYDF